MAWTTAQMRFNKMFRFIFSISSAPARAKRMGRRKKWQRMRIKWFLSLLLISICRCSFSHLYFAINNNGHRLTKLLENHWVRHRWLSLSPEYCVGSKFQNSTGQPSSLPSYLAIRKRQTENPDANGIRTTLFLSLFLSQRPQIIENVHAARVFGRTNKCRCRH